MKKFKKILLSLLAMAALNPSAHAAMADDPTLAKVMIDQLERRYTDGSDPLILEADVWIGKDLHKAWFKIDAERVEGNTEELEVQALYSRAVAPFWDVQVGLRHDFRPKPDQTWLAVGLKGLAPYWFETDVAAFLSDEGRFALRGQFEYELMLTQRLILTPEITVNLYARDDRKRDLGAGLADMQAGLRLRYEFVREFAPYVGINWNRKFGETAGLTRAAGGKADDVQFVIGIRAWF